MIIIGGLTRLTDSGLSITEWQLFSGILPPLNNSDWINYFNLYKEIPEFKLQNYSMTLDEFKIIPNDGDYNEYFGKSLAISDDWLAISAIYDDENGEKSGSVYIYYYNGLDWIQFAKINPEPPIRRLRIIITVLKKLLFM